jgi:hypothetical protein
MWQPRHLTTLRASTAFYRDNVTLVFYDANLWHTSPDTYDQNFDTELGCRETRHEDVNRTELA